MNQFFDFQGRGIDRTHVYLIPCTFGTFKKDILAIRCNIKRHHILVIPLLYLRFFRSPFYNINDYKFILSYIFISRKFILIFLQLRLVRNRINHPKVTQFPIIIKHNICMPAIRTPTSIRRNFTILPRIILTSIRKIRDSICSQLYFRSIYSQCFITFHIQVMVFRIQYILLIRRKIHPCIYRLVISVICLFLLHLFQFAGNSIVIILFRPVTEYKRLLIFCEL